MAHYSSLFKKDDVKITQQFHSGHKALDLSRGVVRQPIYSGVKLGPGVVSYTATSYIDSNGKPQPNSWVVYVKYDNGMTCRMFHGQVNDSVVKKGDRVSPGQQVYRTGNTGNSSGDHLHYVLLDKNGVAVDPTPWVINDNVEDFKKGEVVIFTGVQNIRRANKIDPENITGKTSIGQTGVIIDGPRYTDGYEWWDIQFSAGGTGWVANVGKFEKHTPVIPEPPVEPPVVPPEQTECEKEVERLKRENTTLKLELGASQDREKMSGERVVFLEETVRDRDKELNELQNDYDRVYIERNRFENEKLALQKKLDELVRGRKSWIQRLGGFLHKLFGKR